MENYNQIIILKPKYSIAITITLEILKIQKNKQNIMNMKYIY